MKLICSLLLTFCLLSPFHLLADASFVADSNLANGTRTTSTLPAPAGIADNDILLAWIYSYTPVAFTPPAGWAAVTGFPEDFAVDPVRQHFYWKRASSESGNYDFTHSSAVTSGWIAAFRGAITSGNPWDCLTENESSGTTATATGCTVTVNGSLPVMLVAFYDLYGAGSPPAGFTEQHDSGTDHYVYAATSTSAVSTGATGDKSATGFNNLEWLAVLFVVKAEASATSVPASFINLTQ